MSDDMTLLPKNRYEQYVKSCAEFYVLKDMVSKADTIEDLIDALKINGVEVNEELCRLVR